MMGDSDDEYDRRRARDKFRRERSDYQEHGGSTGRGGAGVDDSSRPRGRDDYPERRELWTRDRAGRRDYSREQTGPDPRGRRERPYSPGPRHDISPPIKKMRRDWDDRVYGYDSGFGTGSSMGSHQNWGNSGMDIGPASLPAHLGYVANDVRGGLRHDFRRDGVDGLPTQPPLMTFKQFLASQDDGIGDEEAVRKYNEYKLEFRRLQLNKFYLAHKEEEWFRLKYQPEESSKKRLEHLASLKRRVDVFLEMMNAGRIESLSVDADRADDIIKLLDAVVIKLEGGTEFDLKVLDETEDDRMERALNSKTTVKQTGKDDTSKDKTEPESEKHDPASIKDLKLKPVEPMSDSVNDNGDIEKETVEVQDDVDNNADGDKTKDNKQKDADEGDSVADTTNETKVVAREKISRGELSSDDEHSDSESDGDELNGKNSKSEFKDGMKSLKSPSSVNEADEEEGECSKKEPKVKGNVESDDKGLTEIVSDDGSATDLAKNSPDKKPVDEQVVKSSPLLPTPRALHRTCSIFLRNLAPTITKQEVEVMCRRYPGYLRVAIADPQPERRFFRRGWVTFDRSVNIKEICWNLNNVRLRDCELGAIVNRDLTRRIRSCSGIALHKQVVRSDIKIAAKLVQALDVRHELWSNKNIGKENEVDQQEEENGQLSFGLVSRNPLLKNITDYLIEEASAEEEELLGLSNDASAIASNTVDSSGAVVGELSDGSTKKEESSIERDDALTKVLDRLLLYLRIVHSIDYYNHSDYPNEDEMPNRCGIMHARGPPPLNRLTPHEITDYMSHFEAKMANFQQPVTKLSNDEAVKLGKKDPIVEVEKFVTANTIELGKDKWLCPLSGKKFKGPEFVRKHIFNKHGEKVEEVKREVDYFNNYVIDPKRPQLPEHPGNRPPSRVHDARESYAQHVGGYQGGYQGGHPYPPPYGGQNPRMHGGPGYGGRGRDNYGNSGNAGGGGGGGGGGAGYFNHKRGAGRNRGAEGREIVGYHDLDAPEDVDVF